MKKQNANNRLTFNKVAVTELNNSQIMNVNGGSTPTTVSSASCAIAIASAVVAIWDWLND
ncbi:class IIb bacteriocin, lactobin A/cerein 7B family [Flavobacterium sp.]|jgi:lactobin A/cerein 7B family class IIb bacteriocin|uniref:class IIb bacteriocin, lactobin A/cerein 7B family n=1 Tax=Flavobacterium sp. TaxID=239 RepID=UPI00375381E3